MDLFSAFKRTDRRVLALGFARMADSMGNSFLIVVLPLYISSNAIKGSFFGFQESLITGLILGFYGLISSILQPFSGTFSDRIGKRKLLVLIGLFVFMLANFAYAYADSYVALFVVRGFQGLSAALTITASVALVSEVSESGNRGQNMGIYNSFRLIGFGAGPLLSGLLIDNAPYKLPLFGETDGFTASFILAASMAFISLILVQFLVADPDDIEPSTRKVSFSFLSETKDTLLDPVLVLGLGTFVMSTGFALIASIEPEINERLEQGAFMFSLQFSVMVGALAISQPIIGGLSDRYSRKAFIFYGLLALVPVTFLQGLSTESWHLILTRGLQGISGACVFAPALALAGDLSKKGEAGAKLSVLTVAFGLGISFGSFVSGYSIRFGFLAPFATGSIFALLGSLLVKTQIPNHLK